MNASVEVINGVQKQFDDIKITQLNHQRAHTTTSSIHRSQLISAQPLLAGQKRKRVSTAPSSLCVNEIQPREKGESTRQAQLDSVADNLHISLPSMKLHLDFALEMDAMYRKFMNAKLDVQLDSKLLEQERTKSLPELQDVAVTLKRTKRIKTQRPGSEDRILLRQQQHQLFDSEFDQLVFESKFVAQSFRDLEPVENIATPTRPRSVPHSRIISSEVVESVNKSNEELNSQTFPPRGHRKPLLEIITPSSVNVSSKSRKSLVGTLFKALFKLKLEQDAKKQNHIKLEDLLIVSASQDLVNKLSQMTLLKLGNSGTAVQADIKRAKSIRALKSADRKRSLTEQVLLLNLVHLLMTAQNKSEQEIRSVKKRVHRKQNKKMRATKSMIAAQQVQTAFDLQKTQDKFDSQIGFQYTSPDDDDFVIESRRNRNKSVKLLEQTKENNVTQIEEEDETPLGLIFKQ